MGSARSAWRRTAIVLAMTLLTAAACADGESEVNAVGGDDPSPATPATSTSIGAGEGTYRVGGEDEIVAPDAEGGGEAPAPRPTDEADKPAPAPSGSRSTAAPGIEGTVLLSGRCPVEQGDDGCPATPTAGTVTARVVEGTTRADAGAAGVASTQAAQDGTFFLAVPAGRYEVVASVEGAQCKPVTVDVVSTAAAHVDLHCDSGIR